MLHGIPHVFEAQVQRREAKAQDVLVHLAAIALACTWSRAGPGAVVSNHAACNQRLHDGVGTAALAVHARAFVARQAHLRAALGVLTRRGKAQAVARAALFHQLDEQIGERQRLGAQRRHAAQALRGGEHIQPALQGRQADHGLRAAQVAGDARGGLVVGRELEGRGVAPPARQGLPEPVGMARVHPHKGRCAGAAVQVLVAAANRKISVRTEQVHRHGARAVRQVPHAQNALGLRGGGDGGHVVHGAGAVVHMRQHQHGHVAGQRCVDLFRLHQHQFQPALFAQAFGNVEVGGEVAALAHDAFAGGAVFAGNVQRRAQHLVEVDGGAVGAHHLVLARANQGGELVAQALGQVKPARGVPRLDEVRAPFALHHIGNAGGRGLGQHAQRIAVQVDHAGGQGKVVAQ